MTEKRSYLNRIRKGWEESETLHYIQSYVLIA